MRELVQGGIRPRIAVSIILYGLWLSARKVSMSLQQQYYRLLGEAALLKRLFSDDAEAAERAWKEFLRRYSSLFLKVIWQFERDVDAAMEKYVYVCTHLAANNLARLRKYQPEQREHLPKLSTWLTIVVKNLCVEERRVTHGRRRLPRALLSLSEFDQQVFKHCYWEGYTAQEVSEMIGAVNSESTSSVRDALDRIEALALRPSKTWADALPKAFVSFDEQWHGNGKASDLDESRSSESLLDVLTSEERLVVQFRFWEDLSAPDIARLMNLSSPRKVYTLLERALKKMRQNAQQRDLSDIT